MMNKMSDTKTPREWDLIIRPKTRWFDLHLIDLWRYRDLTVLFVWRDFVSTYKQTVLGPLWHLITPLLTTLIFTVIFNRIAAIPTDGLPPFLFYMCGLIAWNYFADCLNRTSSTFISNAGIFGKVYFPRLSVPVSVIISNLVKFSIQFALFIGFMIFFRLRGSSVHPNMVILLTPYLLVLMAALGMGAGIIVSSLTTRYRDLQVLVSFGVQLFLYVTPIVYPLSMMPHRFRWLILMNPMTSVIETFRYAFLGNGTFNIMYVLYSTGTTFLLLFLGILLFNHVEKTFMDTV
jgi:lipopolysaccharide transport system permease protein